MAWRNTAAALKLREQVNARWPDRDKRSDGTIGDTAHAARKSDHNPDADGWVKALDIDADLDRERAELQAQLDALKPSTPPATETADKAKPAAKGKKGGKKKAADATEAFVAAQGE